MNLKNLLLIDFVGALGQGNRYTGFSNEVVSALRSQHENKVALVLDYGFGFEKNTPYVVSDQLNLTGANPLVGPNDPCGERFPVVNDIYITDLPGQTLPSLPRGILGGLRDGVVPSIDEDKKLRSLGAEFFSYNLAQTMIVAAHAGWKLVGLVVPKNTSEDQSGRQTLDKALDQALDQALIFELQALIHQE